MATNKTPALPLAGIRVLDLTLARAGPTCVRHLADWGAEVITVQAPDGGEALIARDGFDYQNLHRGKRFINLDLKTAKGREAFLRLVERADVLVLAGDLTLNGRWEEARVLADEARETAAEHLAHHAVVVAGCQVL